MSLIKGISVVSFAVPDLAAAKPFYAEVLGLGTPVYDLPEMGWIEFSTGDSGGHLSITTAEGSFAPSTNVTVVLNVDDCVAAVETLRARGVRCDDPIDVPGMVLYANVYDPFGNRLQICSDSPG